MIDKESLQAIKEGVKNLLLLFDEKEELLLRINWLGRLYKVQQELEDVQTKEEAQKLLRHISPCQTSPLKKQLTTELETLVESLPSEQVEEVQMTSEEVLMEFAIGNAGDDFINLGSAGREHVVNDLLGKFGEDVPLATIQEAVSALVRQVDSLAEIEDPQALQGQLETLPLSNYLGLSSERKQMVAEQLIENRQWKGLASLDRLIRQLDAKLSAAEEQEMMKSMESGIATSLDFNQFEGFAIQIR